jgi:protein-disulfide isomerase
VTNRLAIDTASVLAAAAQEGPSSGDAAAAVTVVEFSDFECPYCRAAQQTVKRVMERWPGKVRLVFKHFPLDQHPNAATAARAAVCADRQGRFWELHDRIFEHTGSLTQEFLRSAANNAGLDIDNFDNCMRSTEVMDHIRKDMTLGRMAGVSGTPSFFVNGEAVAGAAALEAAVESALGGNR